MERRFVTSSNLLSVGYNPYTGVLEIAFHNGHLYQSFSIPSQLYSALMNAESQGQFFNYYILGHYRFQQIR